MTARPECSLPSVSGVILAGGASSRFGETKPLARLGGRPLVRWVGDALAAGSSEIVVSIGVRDVSARFRVAVPEARIVRDRHGNRGPIEGLRRGTSVARGDVVLVAPADAPLLQPALYVALLRVLGDHDAAVSRPSVFDPLRAVYRRGAVLRALRASGDAVGSPSALVDRLDAVFLEGAALRDADPTLSSFIDVNRREDLEHALRVATPPIGVATPS